MKALAALASLFLIVPVALAGAVRTVTAPAPVLALAADGPRIAYATGRSASDCNRVFVWNLTTRGVSKLGRKTHCEQTSTGNSIAAVSIAGTRVLWLHYVGGNSRDWTLWTATIARPEPRLLRKATADADATAPIVLGHADGTSGSDLLPFAVGRDVIALRADGSRAFLWSAPARVTAVGANHGEVAVGRADGKVTVLDSAGAVERELAYEGSAILAAFVTGSGTAVQRGREIIRNDGHGVNRVYPMPPGSRLVDAEGTVGLYVSGGGIVRRISFANSVERSYGEGGFAQLESGRVAIGSGRVVRVVAAG